MNNQNPNGSLIGKSTTDYTTVNLFLNSFNKEGMGFLRIRNTNKQGRSLFKKLNSVK